MSRFADLVVKQDRSEEEDQELHVLAQQLDYVTNDLGTVIGPSGTVARLRAGSVALDNAGMHTYLGGVETGRIEADGDFKLGSNIAAAATTSFAVFTNAQTYNSESIGAGDVLMGDNSASKANILWDVSTGQLLFRGGTTTQGYIDTDGAAYFGGGDVRLGAGGMVLQTGQAATNQILWEDSAAADGTNYGAVYAYHVGTTPNKYGYVVINAGAEAGGNASSYLNLQAYDANDTTTGTLQLYGGEQLVYTAQAATDNNIANMVSFERTLSGNAADGFGFNFGFILDDDSSAKQFAGIIQTKWSDVSEAMRQMTFFMPDTNVPFLRFDMLTASTYEAAINDGSLDMDFRVESDGNENMLFVDGGNNRVGIGTNAPGAAFDIRTGAAATIGLIVKGAASQSANLQEWQKSNGTIFAHVKKDGRFSLNITAAANGDDALGALMTSYETSGNYYGLVFNTQMRPAANSTATGYGFFGQCYTRAANAYNVLRLIGGRASAKHQGTGIVTDCVGGYFIVGSSSTGAVTNALGIDIEGNVTGGGTITNVKMANVRTPTVSSGTITNLYGLYINDQNVGGTLNYAIVTNAGSIVFNEGGDASTDFRVESTNEDKLLLVDGGADVVRLGDGDTNYAQFSATGDLIFTGTSGLVFGEIYANDVADTITITTAGQANKVQITSFAVDGLTNNMTASNANDDITVLVAGMYFCSVSVTLSSAGGGGADDIGFAVYKNNGTSEFTNLHGHRKLAGGGGDRGSATMSGIVDLAVNDTIEVWIWNEDSTDNVVVDDITLSLTMVGGT